MATTDLTTDLSSILPGKESSAPVKPGSLPTLFEAEKRISRKNQFSENVDPNVDKAFKSSFGMEAHLQKFKDFSPEKRAVEGAKFGGSIGLATNGPVGAVIGAGVGAVAGRGMGLVQSGEQEDILRKGKVQSLLSNTGLISGKKGEIQFGDEVIKMSFNEGEKLRNIAPNMLDGAKDRSHYEIDKTNPLSRRTTSVARPLAWAIAAGMMGHKDVKNPRDIKSVDNTTALLTNMFQAEATNINQIHARAREAAKKLGLSENRMRSFIDTVKFKVDDAERGEILQGLETLYDV